MASWRHIKLRQRHGGGKSAGAKIVATWHGGGIGMHGRHKKQNGASSSGGGAAGSRCVVAAAYGAAKRKQQTANKAWRHKQSSE